MRAIVMIILLFAGISQYAQSQLFRYVPKDDLTTIKLSKKLDEISGLAISTDLKIFTHGDEEGKIFQLNLKTGEIEKWFEIGDKDVEKDFEGISIVKEKFYLVSSKGDIYEFIEGEDEAEVAFEKYETDLKGKYDVEGLCYDQSTESLLLACKEFPGKELDDSRAVYSFNLKAKRLDEEPRFIINLNKLENKWDVEKFKPSAITRHPETGSFFVLGGKGFIIIEISADGEVIGEMKLSEDYHRQPEGIIILDDLTMVISDEADKEKATLTFYPYHE